MIIPYRLHTVGATTPITNYVVIFVSTVTFLFFTFHILPPELFDSMVLREWDIRGMLGSLLLHGDIFHLLGNMLYLWVFGNAICEVIGNIAFVFVYLLLGLAASAAQLIFSGHPAIGASGAINGVVGMTLILFPINKLDCVYGYTMPFFGIFWRGGKFTTKCFWMISAWFFLDILGLLIGGDNVGHWAHLGGFAAGTAVACILLLFRRVETYDPTLIDVLTGQIPQETTRTIEELRAMTDPKYKNVYEESADQLHQAWTGASAQSADHLHQAWMGGSNPSPEQVAASGTVVSSDAGGPIPVPAFRLLRIVDRDQDKMYYFVNDGEAIADVRLETRDGLQAEIQPQKLIPHKAPGWIHVKNPGSTALRKWNLTLSFCGTGGTNRGSKELSYDEADNKFLIS